MTLIQAGGERRLRVWPGVVAGVLQWLVWLGLPIVAPSAMIYGFLGGLAGGLAVLVWWAFFSRVPHVERWGALALIAAAVAATPPILHPSIAGGMMGLMFRFFVIPGLCLALVGWAVISRRLNVGPRRAALAAAILAACGAWALVRTDGLDGNGRSQFAWRWTPTAEQRLLARTGGEVAAAPAVPATPAAKETPAKPAPRPLPSAPAARAAHREAAVAAVSPSAPVGGGADWPGFRGAHRDGIVTGVRIKTDWVSSPPVELWRRAVGPGWSSFAVHEGRLYTQEQRGDFEVVACYDAATGNPVWTHSDAARFWESNAGPGPRGTPTLGEDRVYTFGATGILNALNAGDGSAVWSRNAAADTHTKVPEWGFASSPLLMDDAVIVATAGQLAAYDIATGAPRWVGPPGKVSYSSPQLVTSNGVAQILLLNGAGAVGVAPADGKLLWEHEWAGYPIVQPGLTADGDVLISVSQSSGMRRLVVAHEAKGWSAKERWTSAALKPYFNDFVVHKGHAYGFDGGILACIDLRDGTRKWKGGRYGHGQLLLLADQDLLLVLSEEGELALVAAAPGQFTEVARFAAMADKTWNHPVLAGDMLLVRNGREMVAYRLALAGG